MPAPKNYNNPFAIIQPTPDKWQGLTGKRADGFLQFANPYYGARAGFINFINAYLKRGLNTIEKIFPVYAPLGHGANIPEDYIKRVVQLTGIPRNKKISDTSEIYKIGKAIVTHEDGKFWMTTADFDRAFNDAIKATRSETIFKAGAAGASIILLLIVFLILIS